MGLFSRIFRSNFFIRIKSWEYWPFGIIQAPLFPYWIWLSIRTRSLAYFSASNPGILMGGMFGESKFEVMEKVPESVKPKTILLRLPVTMEETLDQMKEAGLTFPVIFKPDLGERGWMVKKINDAHDIVGYLKEIKINFIAQEFVDLPLEFGVYYRRYPHERAGVVTSIVGKEMLSVEGDGKRSLKELILDKDRAKLQWKTLKVIYQDRLNEVVARGKRIELVSVGNHCLGTMFLNRNHLISEKMSASFDHISKQVEGFYFGRYDLRTVSVEDLENGNVKIMELNGCGAEPAHIYEPGFSLTEALKVLVRHWKDIYLISVENHRRGVAYISLQEAKAIFKTFKSLTAP
jgi:hypothetical protein